MKKNIINKKSEEFLTEYLNNPSPTGFESAGQKMWLNYIKPYIHTHFVDTYGTVVGVINPEAKYKVVIDSSTTTQADIENNTIRGKIFLQPVRAIEFVALDFVVTNAGTEI